MPKWFSEDEKELIRRKLLEQGEKQFSRFGFKKTNVEEIALAVGISKGAFYRFFDSKELLFMEVIEEVEIRGRKEILKVISQPGPTPRARLFAILKKAFDMFGELPILRVFTGSDFEILVNRVPVDVFQAHMASDRAFFEELFSRCEKNGINIKVDAEEIVELLYPLVIGFLSGIGAKENNLTGNLDKHLELIAAYCLGEITLEISKKPGQIITKEEGKLE